MPEILRQPVRMDCNGVDLVHPVDRMPPGYFPFLQNTRVVSEGRIDARPGYNQFIAPSGSGYHSIRRLNDPDGSYAPDGYIYVAGNGSALHAGTDPGPLTQIDAGYSGYPLSLIPFRPEAAPESFMYVYDQFRQRKVRPDKAVRQIGVAPPPAVTEATYGTPALVELSDGQDAVQWAYSTGPISIVDPINREGTSITSSITTILYDNPVTNTGWCCMNVLSTDGSATGPPAWAGERSQVVLDFGGGNQETVVIREIHPAITATSIQGIKYDNGTTGLCSIVLTGSPSNLARNSIIILNASSSQEAVRVLAVIPTADGVNYSIRCKTNVAHVAGETVTGLISWYVYTNTTHVINEDVRAYCVYARGNAPDNVGTSATIRNLIALDASKANGRPISIADDYMHISFWATVATSIAEVRLWIDVDAGTTTIAPSSPGSAFTNNYYIFTLSPSQIFGNGIPTEGSWNEIVIPLSEGVRVGNDLSRTLANVQALMIEVIINAQTDFAFDWWYLFGTYGPTIQPNDPVGLLYASRNRDSTTGAASVPGPQTRYQLFPLREEVLITPATSSQDGVDSLDIYRLGGGLANFTYVGTVANDPASPKTYSDSLPDSSAEANPVADFTLLQPWPLLVLPWQGVVNVVGTTVTWVSGTQFNLNLLSAQVILINGVAYQTYGQPKNGVTLEITRSAGVLTNATFAIQSPTLAAQPLPFAFGPMEGPFAPVAFGLGDPVSGGTLYFTNAGNLDAASDTNNIEICAPSEPLISGAAWRGGTAIVGSREHIYLVRYSFQQTPPYQFEMLPSPSGMWSRWACCTGQDGVYFLGRDGLYRANESGVERVASPDPREDPLYPLFPHDGQPAAGTPDLAPVDMTMLGNLRLTAGDNDIYFDYIPVS